MEALLSGLVDQSEPVRTAATAQFDSLIKDQLEIAMVSLVEVQSTSEASSVILLFIFVSFLFSFIFFPEMFFFFFLLEF